MLTLYGRFEPACRLSGLLLDRPAIPIGIVEKDETVPVAARSLFRDAVFEMLHGADVHVVFEQMRPRCPNVVHHELKSLERAGCHGRQPDTEGDGAGRSGRRQLNDPERIPEGAVDVDLKSHAIGVELLRPIDVGDGDHNNLELPIHHTVLPGWIRLPGRDFTRIPSASATPNVSSPTHNAW